MPQSWKKPGILFFTGLAMTGLMILWITTKFVDQYETVNRWGQPWLGIYLATIGIGALLIVVVVLVTVYRLWNRSRQRRQRKERQRKNPSELSLAQQEFELQENLADVENLSTDSAVPVEMRKELAPLTRQVQVKHDTESLEIVAFGTISSGKSSLLNLLAGHEVFVTDARGGTTVRRNDIPWPGEDRVVLVDTPGLAEIAGKERQQIAANAARDADLVLLVVDGPLRQSEFELLELLSRMEKRILICLNKEDLFSDSEKMELVGQIIDQVKDLVSDRDVVTVRAQPTMRTRIRVLSSGKELSETVEIPADIQPLAQRCLAILRDERRQLLLANLLLQSRGLVEQARRRVRDSLDQQAWKIVERHMWGASSAAALSPFPFVDLVAGCAISTKLVLDLARVYHQSIDLKTAVRLLSELGKHLLGLLGGVTAAAAVGSLLKAVPGAGWVVGGLLQGISQALITRWIGAVFIEYFGDTMQEPEGGLVGIARRQWEQMTTVLQMRQLIGAARKHLSDEPG